MRQIVVDCSGVTSTSEFWQRYVDATKPEAADLFGRNLDALWDAIGHRGPGWPGEVRLVFTHASELAPLRTGGGGSFLDALRKLASDATQIEVRLA